MSLEPTTRGGRYVAIGKYRVVKHLATGGMGAVYRAFDEELRREVALKVIPHELIARPGVIPRFRREAELGIKLRHEHLVALFEFGEAHGTWYLAMEFVDGPDLHDYLNEHGPLTGEESRQLIIQAARALEYANQEGVVHRDIKPSNLLIGTKHGKPHLKLADLGLARETREDEFRLTRAGCTVGTIDYMSPEQARDSQAADTRSDMYSLGCTWFHMLTGKPPFGEGSLTERVYRHREEKPADVCRLNPTVSVELAAILMKMLAKDPADRYQTPAELLLDLEGRRPARKPTPVAIPYQPPPAWEMEPLRPKPKSTPRPRTPTPAPPPSSTSTEEMPASPLVSNDQRRVAARQFEHARRILDNGSSEYAIQLLLTCCRLDPENVFYRQTLRQTVKEKFHDSEPSLWRSWLATLGARTRMKSAAGRNDHARVLEYGEAVLARNPWDLATQLLMAEAAEKLGLRRVAMWVLEEARRRNANNLATNWALARLYEKEGQYADAIKLLELIRKADPSDAEAYRKSQDLAARDTIRRGKYESEVGRRLGAS